MKVRIVSDGGNKPGSTKVIHVESGQEIANILGIYLQLEESEDPIAAIEILRPQIDISAEAKLIGRCPHCGGEADATRETEAQLAAAGQPKVEGRKFWEEVSQCKCGHQATIKLDEQMNLNKFAIIQCYGCDNEASGETFDEALKNWEIKNGKS